MIRPIAGDSSAIDTLEQGQITAGVLLE
jgi:hypothetical protein